MNSDNDHNSAAYNLLINERTNANKECVKEILNSFENACITFIVIGASGHLARTKTYPALFSLYKDGLLSKNISFVGYARSKLTNEAFRERISPSVYKKVEKKDESNDVVNEFLNLCTYFSGQYDSNDDFTKLDAFLKENIETKCNSHNRVFYMAIPPNLFEVTAGSVKNSCLSQIGWNRIIVEKPFGRDTKSYRELSHGLLSKFDEEQIYRIDHYLGKEMVQNLMVLRFSNSIFQPTWNRDNIQSVMITFKEADGVEGRGGYFDQFGIIRDVMQNHLMQILTLITMESPVSLSANDIRDEKVKALRSIEDIDIKNVIIGQYESNGEHDGYRDDPTVPDDSNIPTYAMVVMFLKNPRWEGVPFILKCGKGLNERKAEVRIQFKHAAGSLYGNNLPLNELVVRLQPSPAIWLKFLTKSPGLSENIETTELDLTYTSRFDTGPLPDAYERLILDVIKGDHRLFVRNDELEYAWQIFTPLLNAIDDGKIKSINYTYGTRGPKEADDLASKMGFIRVPEFIYTKRKDVY